MPRAAILFCVLLAVAAVAQQTVNVRRPNAPITAFASKPYDLHDGRFTLSADRVYMVGTLDNPPGRDRLDSAAAALRPAGGTAEIDVDAIRNTGTFVAKLTIPEGDLELAVDRWHEFIPCQDGGVVGYLAGQGTDAGCGDSIGPETVVYLAGWGFGHATLNGKPLYRGYEMHFMVTRGIRDRKTLKVADPLAGRLGAGEVDPATQQIDVYVRSPQTNPTNQPARDVVLQFFGMDLTWN